MIQFDAVVVSDLKLKIHNKGYAFRFVFFVMLNFEFVVIDLKLKLHYKGYAFMLVMLNYNPLRKL